MDFLDFDSHYKWVFTKIDKSLKVDERKELKEIQEKIASCYVATIDHAISHNYLYKLRLDKQKRAAGYYRLFL